MLKNSPQIDIFLSLYLTLADEPTGNLDRRHSKEIVDMLKLSNRHFNQTILLITHDEKIALEADRIVTLEDGRIVSDQCRGGASAEHPDVRQGKRG